MSDRLHRVVKTVSITALLSLTAFVGQFWLAPQSTAALAEPVDAASLTNLVTGLENLLSTQVTTPSAAETTTAALTSATSTETAATQAAAVTTAATSSTPVINRAATGAVTPVVPDTNYYVTQRLSAEATRRNLQLAAWAFVVGVMLVSLNRVLAVAGYVHNRRAEYQRQQSWIRS